MNAADYLLNKLIGKSVKLPSGATGKIVQAHWFGVAETEYQQYGPIVEVAVEYKSKKDRKTIREAATLNIKKTELL